MAFFTWIYFDTKEEVSSKYDYCESKGYESYKDESIGFNSRFRCAKKVYDEIGYEWEYSGIVEDNTQKIKMTNEEPNWELIRKLNPLDAYMKGYKKGREDSQDLNDGLLTALKKATEDIMN